MKVAFLSPPMSSQVSYCLDRCSKGILYSTPVVTFGEKQFSAKNEVFAISVKFIIRKIKIILIVGMHVLSILEYV